VSRHPIPFWVELGFGRAPRHDDRAGCGMDEEKEKAMDARMDQVLAGR
jgi:hypothetical protein